MERDIICVIVRQIETGREPDSWRVRGFTVPGGDPADDGADRNNTGHPQWGVL